MVLVDIHSHMDFKDFDNDRNDIVESMKENNIFTITNTLNFENYKYTKELFKDSSDVVKVVPGLYPQDAEKITDKDLEVYFNYLKKNEKDFDFIGEIGLDKHHTKDENLFLIQVKRFRQLLDLAVELDKAVIVHTRRAEVEVLDILKEYKEKYNFRKVVLHCFSGKKKLIKEIRELGVICSIPLILKNTESFRILVSELAITQILVETDSPFLHPEKKRNSPLEIPQIYSEIAQIKGFDKKEIEIILFRNYQKLLL